MTGLALADSDRLLEDVAGRIEAGLRFDRDVARRAIRLTLEAAGLPSDRVSLRRVSLFTEVPDELIFEPVELRGVLHDAPVPWVIAAQSLSEATADRLEIVLDALANAAQSERPGEVLMEVIV